MSSVAMKDNTSHTNVEFFRSGILPDVHGEKQRKLTSDSGFDDDICEYHKNSLSCYCETSVAPALFPAMRSYSLNNEYDHMNNELTPKKEKDFSVKRERRMTPVPLSAKAVSPLQSYFNNLTVSKFISVDEEDADDVEKYNSDDDYVTIIRALSAKDKYKRKSWHGNEGKQRNSNISNRFPIPVKSKSLDFGINYPRRRRCNSMASTIEMKVDNNEGKSLSPSLVGSKTTCYAFKSPTTEERESKLSYESNDTGSTLLPQWMRDAAKESDMTSSDTATGCSGDERPGSLGETRSRFCKLDLPEIDWEKINATKNRNNEILKNQRKNIVTSNTQKMKKERRRRKITPSESPSVSSLDQLSKMKSSADQWKVLEEEEDEES